MGEDVESSLLEHARVAAADRGTELAPAGYERVRGLVADMAANVTDDADIARAEESVRRLVETAADAAAGDPEGRRAGNGHLVEDKHVDGALLSLCPGLWPFC